MLCKQPSRQNSHLGRSMSCCTNALTKIDEQNAEDIVRHRTKARARD
jgi:hypothetical protein